MHPVRHTMYLQWLKGLKSKNVMSFHNDSRRLSATPPVEPPPSESKKRTHISSYKNSTQVLCSCTKSEVASLSRPLIQISGISRDSESAGCSIPLMYSSSFGSKCVFRRMNLYTYIVLCWGNSKDARPMSSCTKSDVASLSLIL